MFRRQFILVSLLICLTIISSGCNLNSANNNQNSDKGSVSDIGLDKYHNQSTDGKYSVFIRDIGDSRPSENFAEGYDVYNKIIIKNNITNEERVVVNSGKVTDLNIKNIDEFPIDILVNLSNPVFSLDNKKIFFNAAAWTTSGAVFSYDITSGDISYLTSGEIKEIIKEGENAGHLLLIKRKYEENKPVMYCEFVINENSGKVIEDLNICL
ncbi:MAG TPA: hypothetical protein PK009_00390 [bacterium]|jgi:hypothetical protein|nr:hypothetical protein [bacterium]HQB76525.1 hypothetical protein [bacterium]